MINMSQEYMISKERIEKIRNVLKEIIDLNKNIKALLLAHLDGSPITSTLTSEEESLILSAILATLTALNQKIVNYIPLKKFIYSTSKFEEGGIFITTVESQYLLLVYYSKTAKLGILMRDVELLKRKLKSVLAQI